MSPRGGTKIAEVIALLQRGDGATLAELVAVTGWLPHTTRAALTGLRKRGYAIAIDRTDKTRGSVYRIEATEMSSDRIARADESTATHEAPSERPERTGSVGTRRAA
jgi:DNA-binding IclR family transcriptional regulator